MKYTLGQNASIEELVFGDRRFQFRKDEFRTSLYTVINHETKTAQWQLESPGTYTAVLGQLQAKLTYRQEAETLIAAVTVKNNCTTSSFKPTTLGFKLGTDCYMDRYPEWDDICFPTLLRCEKTHFWGYCMSPSGKILTITCPQAVASWSMDYNTIGTMASEEYLNGGHRIYTCNLHLLNRLPKPERHPLLDELLPMEEKTWEIQFAAVEALGDLYRQCSSLTDAPMISLDRYTLDAGEETSGCVFGSFTSVDLADEDGNLTPVEVNGGKFRISGLKKVGLYRILAKNGEKVTEASVYLKHPNSWYLEKARDNILEMPPIHTHHVEAFMSLFVMLEARKWLPDPEKDAQCDVYFQDIFRKLYNFETNSVNEMPERIQDSAALSCLMAHRYQLTKDPQDLRYAGHLADFLVNICQQADGAYYSIRKPKPVHYTCVAYLAKYIHETALIEQEAAQKYPEFADAAARHLDSSRRAVQNLYEKRDNIDTEGQITFEDGMISCSMAQLADAAFFIRDPEKKNAYIETAEYMYQLHRCLTQLMIPDCRMNSCTLRFWEAQYNLHIFHNVMNSPCGWTAWKLYGVFYLYILTGKHQYFRDYVNGMGACLQLVDGKTGKLRWGFLCDPYVETQRYVQAEPGVCRGRMIDDVLTEDYVDMVSGWHRTERFPRKKWGIDNLVYEIFKCLAQTGLSTAFVFENENGKPEGWNCTVAEDDGKLIVTPAEQMVQMVHCNFTSERTVELRGTENSVEQKIKFGMIPVTNR